MTYTPARRPTLYFIGVTTGKSSINRVFPAWAELLGLGDAEIRGMDFPLHADPAAYREAVGFIRDDPLSKGALVTTHKIDLYAACRDLFDEADAFARAMGEVSCVSKRGGKLVCHAKDPISVGLAVDGFLQQGRFAGGAELFVMGAGGSAIALTWHLTRGERGLDVPARVVVSDTDSQRLDEIARLQRGFGTGAKFEHVLAKGAAGNDAVLEGLAPGSLVVNATGLGKDRPGSPLSDAALFPRQGVAWDFNYRGDLVFLEQARRQQAERGLQALDGWTYFLHGWTRVIAEVFGVEIPTSGPRFDAISDAAKAARG